MADRVLLGQFRVNQALALAVLAAALRRGGVGPSGVAVLPLRQATVVSTAAGPPPTCTISFDGTNNLAGVRRLASYSPTAGDVVEVVVRSGDPFILGTLA